MYIAFKALTFRPSGKYYYMNADAGHLLTWSEMLAEAAELYDVGDDLTAVTLAEYYILTDLPITD